MSHTDGLDVQITAFDSQEIVAVRGELDLTTAPAFTDTLRRVTSLDVSEILVDLSDVTFLDSTGVGVLVMASRRIPVRIINSSPYIDRVLELAGLDETLSDAG